MKKFSGAGAASSPQHSKVNKPKPSTKKPDIKASASPALEVRATAARTTSDVAKETAGTEVLVITVYQGNEWC